MRRKQVLSLFMLVLGVAMLVAAISVGAASSSTKKAGSAEASKGGTLKLNQASPTSTSSIRSSRTAPTTGR